MPLSKAVQGAVLAAVLASGAPRLEAQEAEGPLLDSLLNIRISAAARYDQTTGEAAASVAVVTREDIERFGYRSVADALSMLGGFYTTFDLSSTFLGTRGFGRAGDGNNRVLILVDGRRWNSIVNSEGSFGEHFSVPVEHIERIEVVRGPGSALYGSSAMLAVVNVVTRTPQGANGVLASAQVGTHGYRRAVASVAGRTKGGIEYSAYARSKRESGPDHYFPEFDWPGMSDGWVLGQDYLESSAASVTVRGRGLSVIAGWGDTEAGEPTAAYGATFGETSWRSSVDRFLEMRLERDLSAQAGLTLQGSYLGSMHEGLVPYSAPTPDRAFDITGNRWQGVAQLRLDLSPDLRVLVGAEAERTNPDLRNGEPGALPDATGEPIRVASFFAQSEWQLTPSSSLVFGGRADRYSTVGSALSPRAAFVHHPSGSTTIKLLFGSAFRAPSPLEQFIEEPGILEPNPALKPERIRTAEAVVEHRIGSAIQLVASAYDFRIHDLISQTRREDNVLTYQNSDRIHGRGASFEVNGYLATGTQFFGNATVQTTEDQATHEVVANSPRFLMRTGVSSALPGGFGLSGTLLHDSERISVWGTPVGSATRVDAHLRTPALGSVAVTVSVANLVDAAYGHPGGSGHRQLSIPQIGRTLRVALTARF